MKLVKIIDSGIPILCGLLLIGIVLLTFMQIVMREMFDFSLVWGDEVSQFCMTWLILIGSIWITKNDQHMNTGLKMHQKLNKRQIYLIDSLLALLIVVVAMLVAYRSTIFAFQQLNTGSCTVPWIKMGYVFAGVPFAMLALSYYNFKNVFKNLVRILHKD
jgi:C4-dicarboxylate transporter DctQ subunit